jgi:hypothetical protein
MKFPARRAVAGDKFLRLKINKRFESHLFHPFDVAESWWIIEERVGSMRLDLSASLSLFGGLFLLFIRNGRLLSGRCRVTTQSGFLLGFQQARNIKASSLLYGPCEMKLHGHF